MSEEEHNKKSGFTLIELLAVMGIMLLVTGIAIMGFYGKGQGDRLRASVETMTGTISFARQYAIAKNAEVTVTFVHSVPAGDPQYYQVDAVQAGAGSWRVREPTYLPKGIEFDGGEPPPDEIIFDRDGTATANGAGGWEINLRNVESDAGVTSVQITIFPATGLTEVNW